MVSIAAQPCVVVEHGSKEPRDPQAELWCPAWGSRDAKGVAEKGGMSAIKDQKWQE